MSKPTFDEEAFARLLEGAQAPRSLDERRMGALVSALERARPAAGMPPFAGALRDQILSQAAVVAAAERAARLPIHERAAAAVARKVDGWRRSFRVVSAFGLAAAMLLVSGAAFASARNALPGQWNYSLKRVQENAHLAFTQSPLARGYYELSLARTRLNEVRGLAEHRVQDETLYRGALKDMNGSTLAATDLLVNAARHGAGISPLEQLSRFAVAQRLRLASIVDLIPPTARPAARDSIDVLIKLGDRIGSILAGCPCPANPLQIPTVEQGSDGQPACTCSVPQPDGRNSGSSGTDAAGNDGSSNTGGDHPTGGRQKTEKPGTGTDVLPGTDADQPVNDEVDSVNGTLGGLGLPTPPPLPVPTPTPTLPHLPVPAASF